ncbi:hypothetical protein TRVA0_062S00364 [Trichomonascus vanleenenianus]|uniref:Faf1p n=1 Tax=Trichomonascus vanleenenianus TaxID=2268995 RepID=UPI003ECB2D10
MDSSDDEPQVVRFEDTSTAVPLVSKREKKLFVRSSAPKKEPTEEKPSRKGKVSKEEQEDIKNDLALQRLISESHILAEANQHSGADISLDFDPIGKSRLKALDTRLKSLGAKQEKSQSMPMNMAKGIKQAQKTKQEKYTKHAREAGIILAKVSKDTSKKTKKRDRGLKIASVGRNTRHGLIISQQEIARVTKKRK